MARASTIIDVWDVATFDDALRAELDRSADLIRNHVNRDDEIFREYESHDAPKRMDVIRPENEYYDAAAELAEHVTEMMRERTIRAWHYARMTDDDVARLLIDGIRLSTPEMLRERLDRLVEAELLTVEQADRFAARSPFNSDQGKIRRDAFYLASHPQHMSSSGVRGLLGFWGGEVASFFVQTEDWAQPLATIGASRVIEVAVPVAAIRSAHGAADAVIAAFARSLDCKETSHAFDVRVQRALPSDAILRVHTRGEADFEAMIEHYPSGYAASYARDLED